MVGSSSHPFYRQVSDVLRNDGRRNQRTIVIDDTENVVAALRAGVHLHNLCIAPGAQIPDELAPLLPAGLPVFELPADLSKALFRTEKRSRLFALAYRPKPVALRDLDERPGDLVVLDGVRLAGNIGAVTRSALAFDAAGVVLVDSDLSSTLDRRLVRASRGAVFAVPVLLAEPAQVLEYLSERRIPLVGMDTDVGDPLSELATIRGRVALLMGGERRGSSDRLDAHVAEHFHVSINPEVESLNVSVAAALALYTRRQRAPRLAPRD